MLIILKLLLIINKYLKPAFLFTIFAFLPIKAKENSYSLVDYENVPLDEILIKIMNYKNGIFIEVGAFDGISQSNTKRLEEYHNWTGILIEPSENLFSKLCQNRPNSKCFQCALGSFEENNTYAYGDFGGHTMSSFIGRRGEELKDTVLIRSLQSILDECNLNHINFFSLDVEGYELNILKGIDFNKTKFDYLLIEIYASQFDEIKNFLSNKGYKLVKCLTNYNMVSNSGWDGTHNDYLFKNIYL